MFFAEFPQCLDCWSIVEQVHCHEHFQIFYVFCCFLVSVHRPIRRGHSRGVSRSSYGIPFVFCQYLLAHHMRGGSRINDKLCLCHGLMFEEESKHYSNVGEKIVATFSRKVPRILANSWAHFTLVFCAHILRLHRRMFIKIFDYWRKRASLMRLSEHRLRRGLLSGISSVPRLKIAAA